MQRNCYVLTCDVNSERAKFSKTLLEKIGFTVNLFRCIPNKNKLLSNKQSMVKIYELIGSGNDAWVYVFEDDINVMTPIDLNEIIEYEKLSQHFFYLGLCVDKNGIIQNSTNKINSQTVTTVSGGIRGLHAIGLSKQGALNILNFVTQYKEQPYMDIIFEKFSENHPANVVRYDLESYIRGHRGAFFQDRRRFPSSLKN